MKLTRDRLLVSTSWLEEHLDDPTIQVVDCRYSFDRDAHQDYLKSHIPGAVYLDWARGLSDPNQPIDFTLAPPEQVEATMSQAGIGNDRLIIAYDDEGGHHAARVWLVLAYYGRADQIRLLDGGWTKWLAEGRPTSPEVPEPKAVTFTVNTEQANPQIIATVEDVLAAREHGEVILDVRRRTEFTGEEARAKRGGRIPGAVHLLWQDNVHWDTDRSFKTDDEIRRLGEDRGITSDTPVITYCQGGVRAAHTAIALLLAGFDKVRVYDGSWAEWGNRDDLPIETGSGDSNSQ